MSDDNETVEQVCESVEYLGGTDGGGLEIFGEHINPISLADRILSAHNREMAAKDAEIEKLKFDNLHLKSCQRQSGEVIIEQTNKVEAKDEEIERLREIVKELADELETMICNEIVKSSKRRGRR